MQVSSCDAGFKVSLTRMNLKHSELCIYDTEVFPALITKAENPKATFLIFGSGKFNILGTKTREDTLLAFNYIIKQLERYKALNV